MVVSNIFYSALPGEMIQFDQCFSNGLKPPPSGRAQTSDTKVYFFGAGCETIEFLRNDLMSMLIPNFKLSYLDECLAPPKIVYHSERPERLD